MTPLRSEWGGAIGHTTGSHIHQIDSLVSTDSKTVPTTSGQGSLCCDGHPVLGENTEL